MSLFLLSDILLHNIIEFVIQILIIILFSSSFLPFPYKLNSIRINKILLTPYPPSAYWTNAQMSHDIWIHRGDRPHRSHLIDDISRGKPFQTATGENVI